MKTQKTQQSYRRYERRLEAEFRRTTRFSVRQFEDVLVRLIQLLEIPLGSDLNKKYGSHWFKAERHGWSVRLSLCHIVSHLLWRSYSVGIIRSGRTSLFVIDLDAKGAERKADLLARYLAVVAALGLPTLVVQSSDSGGIHLYYFLSGRYDPNELRAGVKAALLARQIRLEDGTVELFPNGRKVLRLPFGPGSCLLDPERLTPLHAIHNARTGEILSLYLRETLDEFERLVARERRELKEIVKKRPPPDGWTWTSPEETFFPCNSANGKKSQKKTLGQALKDGKLRGPEFWDAIRRCETGVSAYGKRFAEHALRLWLYVFPWRMSEQEALQEDERYLREGEHVSHDLELDFEGTILRMLREARPFVRKLIGDREKQPDHVSSTSRSSDRGATNKKKRETYTYASHLLWEREKGWQRRLLSYVTLADRALVDRVDEGNRGRTRWLRRRLLVLVGLLRLHLERSGGLIALDCEALRAICGHKAAPGTRRVVAHHGDRVWVLGGHSTTLLREAATSLGIIELRQRYVACIRPYIYEVTLDPRRHS